MGGGRKFPGRTSEPSVGNRVRSFEDLWIWQEARQLVKDVYRDFADGTAGGRDFGFRWQIQRSAVSVMNNIAEGFERTTNDEFARFLDISKGSCGEVRSMYYSAEDLKYVASAIANERRARCRPLASGISTLAAHLRQTAGKAPP